MKYILIYCFLLCTTLVYGQLDYGFLGGKNLIGVSVNSGVNLLYNLRGTSDYYMVPVDHSTKNEPWVRVNYKLEYQRLLKNDMSIGLELGVKPQKVAPAGVDGVESFSNESYYSTVIPFYNGYSVVPTVAFNQFGAPGFSGFSFQFGIGPTFFKLNKSKTEFFSNIYKTIDEIFVDPDKLFVGMNLFGQLNFRINIEDNLFFDIGGRVNSDFFFGEDNIYFFLNYYVNGNLPRVTEDNQRAFLKRKGAFDLFSLKCGISFQF